MKRTKSTRRKRNPEELRARKFARLLGVPWREVIETRNQLQALEREQRQTDDEVRQAGWHAYVHYMGWSISHLKFWRAGFQRVLGGRIARGADHTSIRYYDEIADSVRSQCPQVAEWDTADIWELLLSEYPPLRPVAEHYRNAVAMLAARELNESTPF